MMSVLPAKENSSLYAMEGYCVQQDVFSTGEIAELCLSLDRMIEERPAESRLESLVEPNILSLTVANLARAGAG